MPSTSSPESSVQYPTEDDLRSWIEFLKDENTILKLALPADDDNWYEQMMSVVQRVQYSYSEDSLHNRAAELFYNTNKAHNFGDGNKRSSIVITYLFYVLNDKYIVSKLEMKKLAKDVAKSRGRARHDGWIRKICEKFERYTIALVGD